MEYIYLKLIQQLSNNNLKQASFKPRMPIFLFYFFLAANSILKFTYLPPVSSSRTMVQQVLPVFLEKNLFSSQRANPQFLFSGKAFFVFHHIITTARTGVDSFMVRWKEDIAIINYFINFHNSIGHIRNTLHKHIIGKFSPCSMSW